MLLTLSVLTGKLANFPQIIIERSLFDYYFSLWKAFNTNILHFHEYFKDKINYLSINHLTRTTPDTEQIVILTLHFLIIQKLKMIFAQNNSHMELPSKFA